jgi:hypothetical protein
VLTDDILLILDDSCERDGRDCAEITIDKYKEFPSCLQCRKDRICAAIVSMSSRLSLANEYLRTKTLHDEITKAHIESYMADQLSSDQEHIRKECSFK